MTNKFIVTRNEYQKIEKDEISKYWRKVIDIRDDASMEEIKGLKHQYMMELEEELSKYEVEPYYHEVEAISNVLNAFFTEDKDKTGYKFYKGFTQTEYSDYRKIVDELNLTILTDCGYYRCAYNSEYQIIFTYCEGDLILEVADNKEIFEILLKATKKVIKENY